MHVLHYKKIIQKTNYIKIKKYTNIFNNNHLNFCVSFLTFF